MTNTLLIILSALSICIFILYRKSNPLVKKSVVPELVKMYETTKTLFVNQNPNIYSAIIESQNDMFRIKLMKCLTPQDHILLLNEISPDDKISVVCMTTRGEILGYLKGDTPNYDILFEKVKNHQVLFYAEFVQFDNPNSIIHFSCLQCEPE
ncbi:hypothetical protein K4L44_04500 [Halosquirtibacter laminarini]|uniref:Uncharacterized protein n=1 Tax=Halosquirtibacter laminarini TaxID=3374600 RepID=A0AC61NPM6_9BACT|nr:hypothetical protein K4L44_04500 [Prolixibacteraceae bacterium]